MLRIDQDQIPFGILCFGRQLRLTEESAAEEDEAEQKRRKQR